MFPRVYPPYVQVCIASIGISGTKSPFANLEKFSLNFSSLSFVIRVNLFHP